MTYKTKIKKNQQGIAVLLAVLILSSLTIIVLAVSDVVLRVGRSSRQIGYSEIAYYSAEAGIENALYQIEKNQTVVGLNNGAGSLSDIEGAIWSLELEPIIADTNPYQVSLADGESFQLELNFQDSDDDLNYPSNIQVSWTGSAEAILLKANGEQTKEIDDFILHDLKNNLYVLRVSNSSGSAVVLSLDVASGNLPIGIKLTATGVYKEEQRKIEVQRANWQIY
ncbi:hypothetical protein L6278_00065 [Candidatus Parcubacteria bacterium]|nr:hypothetical protein [Candidatus Parcubacteria bacterium]